MKKVVGLLLVVAGLVAGAWIYFRYGAGEEARYSEPIRRGPVVESVYGIGTVMANQRFQLKPGVVTTIGNIFVKEGDWAAKGTALVELERGVVVSAPFDGTVTALPVKVGENVFAQTIVLELVNLEDRYVTVSLEQRSAIRVRRGQVAKLSFESMREQAFDGKVESVYSSSGDFLVHIEASEMPPQILPGMTADVAITVQNRPDAWLVPVSAIRDGVVTVKREGTFTEDVRITTGLVDAGLAEVITGDLKSGDRVRLPAEAAK